VSEKEHTFRGRSLTFLFLRETTYLIILSPPENLTFQSMGEGILFPENRWGVDKGGKNTLISSSTF